MAKEKTEENKIPENEVHGKGKNRSIGSRLFPVLLIIFCFALAGATTIEILYDARIAPNTFLGSTSLANVPYGKLEAKVKMAIKKFGLKPLVFNFQGKKVNIRTSQIGDQWDVKGFIEKKNIVKKPFQKTVYVVTSLFQNKQEEIDVTVNWNDLESALEKGFQIEETHDAFLDTKGGASKMGRKVLIVDEKEGWKIDREKMEKKVLEFIRTLGGEEGKGNIELEMKKFEPEIVRKDLEDHFTQLEKIFTKILTLQIKNAKSRISLMDYKDWISYKKEEGEIKIDISDDALRTFLKNEFAKDGEYPPGSISITRGKNTESLEGVKSPEEAEIIFEETGGVPGGGRNGQQIDYEEAVKIIKAAFNTDATAIEIPVHEIPAEIKISEDLQAIGIKELIATGYTTYYGSPENRMYNIKNGIAKFNGRIISPGEEFSFNSVLGRVDASTGYRKELVIKPEGTIPEYGGGICQVSTTMYRAALNAGFPITARKPHSYLVSYYAQVGGHGLDATIYPGSSDLKFINDTPGSIIVQSYTDGPEAYFKFYGTKDGRKVELEGPQISNHRSAGEVEFIKTASLPPGTKKQVEKAHKGFDALWYRIITSATGEIKKEEIVSKYKAIPSRILIGATADEIKVGDPTGEQYFRD